MYDIILHICDFYYNYRFTPYSLEIVYNIQYTCNQYKYVFGMYDDFFFLLFKILHACIA